MGKVAIEFNHIGKQYRLGVIGTGTLSRDLNRWWALFRGKEDPYLRIGDENNRSQKATSDYVWALKDIDLSMNPTLDFTRDMFMFSFYTRGMSFVDMAYLRKTDLQNGILTYRRRKTGQELTIKWEKCMAEIIAKYPDNQISSPDHQRAR